MGATQGDEVAPGVLAAGSLRLDVVYLFGPIGTGGNLTGFGGVTNVINN